MVGYDRSEASPTRSLAAVLMMSENPYQSPETPSNTPPSFMPMRLRRGRRVLIVMAAILGLIAMGPFIVAFLSSPVDLARTSNYLEWANYALFQVTIPAFLLYGIWRGRGWARLLLGIGCAAVVFWGFSSLAQDRLIWSREPASLVIFLVCMFIGYVIVSLLAFFSPALSGLMAYRQEERDMQ